MKFRTLIVLTLVLLVAGFVGAVVVVSDRVHERNARVELASALDRSDIVLRELLAFRSSALASALHVTSEEPRLKAVVATDEIEHATVLDVALELRATMGADLFLMVDGEGRLLADTADAEAQGFDMRKIPLVADALRTGAGETIWVDGPRAYQVAARRMAFGDTIVGAVIAGRRVDAGLAESIARQSGSAVIVMLDGDVLASGGAPPETITALASALASAPADGVDTEIGASASQWLARAVPMPGYTGERRLTTAVVGSVDAALAASRELSQYFRQIAIAALVIAIALAVVLSRILARPLGRLVEVTGSIAGGNLDARAADRGPSEIRVLGRAMNKMATELSASHQRLHDANVSLEHTVADRTKDLRATNREIAEMLDNLDDAVMLVGPTMHVEARCSPACASMLRVESAGGADLRDLLFSAERIDVDAESLAIHEFVFQNTFGEPEFQWELNEHLLLREVQFRGTDGAEPRTFTVRYAPLFGDDGTVARVLVVLSDVTELLALRRGIAEQEQRSNTRVEALLAFSRCSRRDALRFVDDACGQVERIVEGVREWGHGRERASLVGAMRDLHTLKGNARSLGLRAISTRAHALEGELEQLLSPPEATDDDATPDPMAPLARLEPALVDLNQQLEIHSVVADEFLRRESGRPRIDIVRVSAWIAALADERGRSRRADTMLALLRAESTEDVVGVAGVFERQRAMIDELATLLGKNIRLQVPDRGEVFVSPAVAGRLRDAFMHAIRNACDHGIEPPSDREAAGKPTCGVLSLDWERRTDHWTMRLSDDGRGVDLDAITALGRRREMVRPDEQPSAKELHELLFAPTLSSKATADDISGRGIGLDAIRTALASCGITVELTSAPGQGCTLELRLPLDAVRFEERSGVPVERAISVEANAA